VSARYIGQSKTACQGRTCIEKQSAENHYLAKTYFSGLVMYG
jgi:hypothetical protein